MEERMYCLGEDCHMKNCEICKCKNSMLDVTDDYRNSVKYQGGYYTRTFIRSKDPNGGYTHHYTHEGD